MESKFNWGWKIALLYSGFVFFMLFLGYKASNEKVELVSDNYYDEELKYQNHIDKIQLTDSLKAGPQWQVNGSNIAIVFPQSQIGNSISGSVHFYCPADAKRDFTVPFATSPQKQLCITSGKLKHGTYKMQIDWKQGKADFYTEGVVTVQ